MFYLELIWPGLEINCSMIQYPSRSLWRFVFGIAYLSSRKPLNVSEQRRREKRNKKLCKEGYFWYYHSYREYHNRQEYMKILKNMTEYFFASVNIYEIITRMMPNLSTRGLVDLREESKYKLWKVISLLSFL